MGSKKRTGTIELRNGIWYARPTLADGSRGDRVALPKGTSEKRAGDVAKALTERAQLKGTTKETAALASAPVPSQKGQTVDEWSVPWMADRENHKLTSVRTDRGRWKKWISPNLGALDMATAGTEDLERFVQALDRHVTAGDLHWKTAKNVWGLLTKAFDDACRSKTLELRVRKDNPAKGVRGPDAGAERSKQYLYPSEFLKLMNCEQVPQRWRRLIAADVYLYARVGEFEALTIHDVDLEQRVVHIRNSIDREKGELKTTKTNNPRRIPIEPNLFPLLEQLVAEARADGRERLVTMPPVLELSGRLRKYLKWAGVSRAELYGTTTTSKQITFHDLRATGITWMAIRGDEPQRIMARAGHENMATTQGYIREAESLNAAPASAFPAIPLAVVLPQASPPTPQSTGSAGGKLSRLLDSSRRPQRDSNPLETAVSAAIHGVFASSAGDDTADCRQVNPRNHTLGAVGGFLPAGVPLGSLPSPLDVADFIRPRVPPEASERAGHRLEVGLRVVRGELAAADPEAEVRAILAATCDDLGLTPGGAS